MTRAPANKSAGTTWQALHQHAGDDGFREPVSIDGVAARVMVTKGFDGDSILRRNP